MNARYRNYLALVNEFPLVPIHDEESYKAASAMAERLRAKNANDRLTVDEFEYMDVLDSLLDRYAPKRKSQQAFSCDPLKALKKIMSENNLTAADIIEISGEHKTNVSAFLNGNRNISKSVAEKLATKFNVDPEIFLPKMEMPTRAEIYLSGGPFDKLHTVKLVVEKINPLLKNGQYELVPYSYKAGFPPYYPLFEWVRSTEPMFENIDRLKFEIQQTYQELIVGAESYSPNNHESRKEQCNKMVERLQAIKQS